MSDDDALTPPTPDHLLAGRFRLGARRGSGTDAALFEAIDIELDRPVVVKVLHPDLSADPMVQVEFGAALEVVGGLHHPHVAEVFGWGEADWAGSKVLYVASEQLNGGSVRDMLDRGRLLSPSQALVLGLDACKALDALHRRGLVHGDVRPSNLVFGDDRRLRLVDAALSNVLVEAAGGASHRINDVAKYASPEEAQGQPRGPKSDVYSLCLTLLETLSGSVPFVGDSTVATLANRVDRLMPVSADLGPLASVLERAGRPTATDRYTAAEFGRALVGAAQRLPRPAPLPILANSLFGPDPGVPGEPVDPTGPITASIPVVSAEVDEPAAAVADPTGETALVDTAGAVDATGEVAQLDPSGALSSPRFSRRSVVSAVVAAAVVVGGLTWWIARPSYHTVPGLAGFDKGVALNVVAGNFKPVVLEEASDEVAVGVVIRTDPPVGTRMKEGSPLGIFVSNGPAPRVLPELVGLSVGAANNKLAELGLVASLGDAVFDEKIPIDQVISWSVPASPTLVAGDTVVKGTVIRLVPSAGPEPRTIPKLVGLDPADAEPKLKELGLVIAYAPDEFSNDVPYGMVARVDPPAGESVPRGSTVTLAKSKGQDLVVLPPLAGLDAAGLTAALEAAGFTVGATVGNPTLAFGGPVVDGRLVFAGDKFPRGTSVDLYFATA
ncbi:MAG: hypothetical protein RLZ14_29 [Actinomycetota bacterium]